MVDDAIVLRPRTGIVDEINNTVVMFSPCIPRDPKFQMTEWQELVRAMRIPQVWNYPKEDRLCSICGEVKPLSEFWKDARLKSGYERRCKRCKRAYNAHLQWEQREIERIRRFEAGLPEKRRGRPFRAA